MRIVSLAPSNTEILYALGCGDEIVACTRFCDYPEEAKQKPRIGGWLDVNDELVLRHKPDAVMTSTFVQDRIAGRCRKKGIALFHTDPKTLEQVYESILAIGKFVHKEQGAYELVQSMKSDFNEVANSMKKESNNGKNPIKEKTITNKQKISINNNGKIKVYCEEWHKPPTVSGNWVPKVIELAGGISLCPEGRVSHPVSPEEAAAFGPECIVLSICGMGVKASPKLITARKGWHSLKAVKENRVFIIDDSLLNRPGPRLAEGARQLQGYFLSLGPQ